MTIFSKTAPARLITFQYSKETISRNESHPRENNIMLTEGPHAFSTEVLTGSRMRLAEMEILLAPERLRDFKQRVTNYGERCAEQKRGFVSEVK
jgi:hypothetical protein